MLRVRNARKLAWGLLGLYAVLIGVGLTLQVVEGAPFAGIPMPVQLYEAVVLSAWALVGALLVSRRPRHPVGWIWFLLAISYGLDQFAWGYAYYGFVTHPDTLPGVHAVIVMQYWLWRGTIGNIGLALLFLLFPTGRPLSRRWGKVAWIAVAAVAVQVPVATLAPSPIGLFPFPTDILAAAGSARTILDPLREVASTISLLCVVVAAFSLFVRHRRAKGVERQQLKWFAYAAAFFAPGILLIVWGLRPQTSAPDWVLPLGLVMAAGVGGMGISVASAVAILRYRLWDIDIIIHRTLVYGFLTAALAIVYLASVVLLQNILQALTGKQSPLVVVVSTLIIAALFSPLRRRIQDLIDRRLYRRNYDAAQILAHFAATCRDQVDMNSLTAELLRVAETTMQPESVSLWLKAH